MRRLPPILFLAALGACAGPPQGQTPYQPSPGMYAVLAERQQMHARPLSDLLPDEARDVPSLIDAAHAIPNVRGLPAPTQPVPQVTQLDASGAEGRLDARLYRPPLARNTPTVIYFPGGTWVTGSIDTYDETARQLAARTGYVVVAVQTRRAPQARFPAIHDDAWALYQWARAHLREWGADPTRVALAGEGPGADLALSVAMRARDDAGRGSRVPMPDALLLVTPLLGTELDTPSMNENAGSRPLSRAEVAWAQNRYAPDNLRDPRIDLAARTDFAGLPPTQVILAPSDPLRSGGEQVAARMARAGVTVETRLYPGTTHDFFGLATYVPEADRAEAEAATWLQRVFYRPPPPPPPTPARRTRHRARR